jgi:hypothetical protein
LRVVCLTAKTIRFRKGSKAFASNAFQSVFTLK